MTRGIFISTANTADERVALAIDLLKKAGYTISTSPLNPALRDDPRWNGWYETDCKAAVESNASAAPSA